MPHAHANAIVFLNQHWLGQGGRFAAPEAHTWNRPLLFPFDGRMLARDQNVVLIGLQLNGGIFNTLGTVSIGPERALRATFDRAMLLRVRPAEASTLLSLGAFLFFGSFGLALADGLYLWLAIAALCCAGGSLNYHLLEPPVASWPFNTFVNVAMQWMTSAFSIFSMRLVHIRAPRLEMMVIGYALLVAVCACLLRGTTFESLLLVWYCPVVALCLSMFVAIALRPKALSRPEWLTSLVTSGLLFPIGLHDLMVQGTMQAGVAPMEVTYLAPFLGPITLVGFGAVLLSRFMRLYRRAQHVNAELQAQVAVAREQLKAEYGRVQELERAQAVAVERSRMQREVHDGIGGHLVAMLAMNERGEDVSVSIRDAIADMRLVICSMEPDSRDLSAVLADMRPRLEPLLRAQGLTFAWDVGKLPNIERLTPSDTLQVARIVQESVTNVVKHADARALRVHARSSEQGGVYLVISDDGRGFAPTAPRGKGLRNMHARAAQIGALLQVESCERGTTVCLHIIPEVTA